MLRRVLLATSQSRGVRKVVETAPYGRGLVRRYIAGESTDDALRVARDLTGEGLLVSLDHLGEDTLDTGHAEATVKSYATLLDRLSGTGLGGRAEVSVKLTALGLALDEDLAAENARRVCAAARAAGTTVTIDMEQHTDVDATLRIVQELRRDHPETGAVIQAYLRRAEEYCAELAYEGSRVRLCKGAYTAPESIAFTKKGEVDKSFVRCMKVLMAGRGYPMLATHDPRLIELAKALALINDRGPESFEYQMLYGIRPQEQRNLAGIGDGSAQAGTEDPAGERRGDPAYQVRVYVPYGEEWYGYMMRRLAERPANLMFFLRSLASKS